MNQSGSGECVGASPVLDDIRLDTVEFEQVSADYAKTRELLASQHAERSRKIFEGKQTAADIRESSEDVTDYINGIATELYLQYSDQGMPAEEIKREIDSFITQQTQLLLGEIAYQRTETVRTHNRFMPKFVGGLYDKFTDKWRSWEVPQGDGELVSRLRETGMWQHLEQKSEGTSRGAKLGRFALTLVTSSINGIENLKHSGARKRLYTMAGIGMLAGATAGVALGVAGAGAAGAFAGAAVSRSAIRTGLGAKLNRDATIEDVALYDQVRMQGQIDQLSSEKYSVDELLGYVSGETEKMVHENNVKLMSGMAIGLTAGLAGNTVARGVSWVAGEYIDANFNTAAHADVLHDGEATHVIKNTHVTPGHVIDGSSEHLPTHVIDGERPNHVIHGHSRKLSPNHVINDDTTPNHVIDGHAKPNHPSDTNRPNHVIDGSSKEKVARNTFYVESGHGFIKEIQDYAKENGYGNIKSAEAYQMHKLLLKEHGKNGLIDVHGIKQDTYVENGDVRISAAGKAHWRTGVEYDLKSLMNQHAQGDTLRLSDSEQADHVIDGNDSNTHPNHVIDGDGSKNDSLSKNIADYTKDRDESVIAPGESGQEFMRELGIHDAKDRQAVWSDIAPQLHDDKLTYYDKANGDWRLNMTSDGKMPVSAIEMAVEAAQHKGIETDYASVLESVNHLSADNSFTANQLVVGNNQDMKAYYDALKNVDPRHKADLLSVAAHDLQSFKLTEKVDGVWRFREVSSLPPKAADILSRIATKNHWTLAA